MITVLLIFFLACLLMLYNYESFGFTTAAIVSLVMYVYVFIGYMYRYRKGNLLCFEFFFSLSLLFCIFSFFINQNNDSFVAQLVYNSIGNDAYLVKGLFVSLLMYISLMMGFCLANGKAVYVGMNVEGSQSSEGNMFQFKKFMFLSNIVALCYTIIFILFIIIDLPFYINNRGAENDVETLWLGWLRFAQMLYTVLVILKSHYMNIQSLRSFYINNRYYCWTFVFLSVLLLLSGARHMFTTIALPMITLFSLLIYRVKNIYVFIGIAFFGFLFVIIRYARVGLLAEFDSDTSSFFNDFIPASLATPWLIEYADTYGYTYGTNYVLSILAIVPFLAGLVSQSGFMPALSSGKLFTISMYGEDFSSGLGTSMVGDVYYSFGLIGSILFFFLFGFFICKLYNSVVVKKNFSPYLLIIYSSLLSESLFFPRGIWTMFIRMSALVCIYYFLLSNLLVPNNSKFHKKVSGSPNDN